MSDIIKFLICIISCLFITIIFFSLVGVIGGIHFHVQCEMPGIFGLLGAVLGANIYMAIWDKSESKIKLLKHIMILIFLAFFESIYFELLSMSYKTNIAFYEFSLLEFIYRVLIIIGILIIPYILVIGLTRFIKVCCYKILDIIFNKDLIEETKKYADEKNDFFKIIVIACIVFCNIGILLCSAYFFTPQVR